MIAMYLNTMKFVNENIKSSIVKKYEFFNDLSADKIPKKISLLAARVLKAISIYFNLIS